MPASIFDALTRQQIYLEGYKSGLDGRFDPVLRGMYEDLRDALAKTNVRNLNELTRKRLQSLIRQVQRLQLRRNDTFRADMLKELRAFAQGNMRMSVAIHEEVEGKTVDEAYEAKDGLPLLGLLALRNTRKGRARLWALIENTPDGATGLTARQAINKYLSFVSRNVRELITRGYAEGWTVNQTLAAIFGTSKKRFRDGFAARAKRAGSAAIHTVVQHVGQLVNQAVRSVFYKFYEWVSVIDMATTNICRSRDGKVYRYRKGPIPPAHYRCRSTTVPLPQGKTYQQLSYFAWLSQQPRDFVDDVLGNRLGGGLRSGRVGAAELGAFSARRSLTLTQFLNKLRNILS
ncbi:head morphogenesis protein [Paracoccus phage vB_PmaS-R3]|uniref:Head morphogenesis protein n=1 Tax=Paracoccus phage vB_PmaS-R3 TaxID=2494563 RepID=A0A0B5A7K0_9CAUD|nr:head morphogenesis [Paracoccus phage vB_PmaS-R3]AJD83161.1 head morphogenesis protein [Paracoccus phage vB_PmaS-R3]